jgi:hypothetical protein
MKKIIIIIIFFLINPVFALVRLGPPISELDKGQLSLSTEYIYDEEDIKLSAYGYRFLIEDNQTDLYFARIGIAIEQNSEIFFRLGMDKIDDLNMDFAWGAGIKAKLAEKDNIKFGIIFQATGIYGNDELNIPGYAYYGGDISIYEFQLGIGPCYDKNEFSIYAYPLFHFITGQGNVTGGGYSMSGNIEQTSEIGGCIGFIIKPGHNFNLNFEGQIMENAYSLSFGILFKFGTEASKIVPDKKYLPEGETGKKMRGYQATTDPKTGKIVTWPVYEP